jgi:hypothetical protein
LGKGKGGVEHQVNSYILNARMCGCQVPAFLVIARELGSVEGHGVIRMLPERLLCYSGS